MARFTGGEQEEVSALIAAQLQVIQVRIDDQHLRAKSLMDAALDQIKDAAASVEETKRKVQRVLDLYEAMEARLEDLEAEVY